MDEEKATRKRYTAEEKAQIMKMVDSREEGETVKEACEALGVNLSTYNAWVKGSDNGNGKKVETMSKKREPQKKRRGSSKTYGQPTLDETDTVTGIIVDLNLDYCTGQAVSLLTTKPKKGSEVLALTRAKEFIDMRINQLEVGS